MKALQTTNEIMCGIVLNSFGCNYLEQPDAMLKQMFSDAKDGYIADNKDDDEGVNPAINSVDFGMFCDEMESRLVMMSKDTPREAILEVLRLMQLSVYQINADEFEQVFYNNLDNYFKPQLVIDAIVDEISEDMICNDDEEYLAYLIKKSDYYNI